MYECKIAEKLVELRALKGVTQGEVAQSLLVSNKTVSKWENGVSVPDTVMVVELSKYYGVTTDELLGLSVGKNQSTNEEVSSLFNGLEYNELIIKAFETVKSFVPAVIDTVSKYRDEVNDEPIFPEVESKFYRYQIKLDKFYQMVLNSENANIAVMLLRNKANFAWMNEPDKQKEIVKLFKFLSDEDVLSVIYFIHSTTCSESFTEDYISKNTGVPEERTSEILDEFCSIGMCSYVTAHLLEGDVKVYESRGDGLVLSLITLAFDRMCGNMNYSYNLRGMAKMIRGKQDEFIG